MSDVLRRQKDQIRKTASNYITTTTSSQYLRYFEGSPTYLIYYRQDNTQNDVDKGLETVNSFIGNSSPKVYDKINNVQVWGVDALDVSTDLMERGVLTGTSGEILFLPNTIVPYPNDYFIFDYEGLETHLFRIVDVQFDKLSSPKFYRCSYSLSNMNASNISNNIGKEYSLEYSGSGLEISGNLVETSDIANTENIKDLSDKLLERYISLFYDEDMDTFVYHSREDDITYWSPYLQHFLHKNSIVKRFNQDLLTEIYVMDIDESNYYKVYNEEDYRNSIFRNIETQNNEFDFSHNFMKLTEYKLKMDRNLPFFMSKRDYRLVAPISDYNNPAEFLEAFPILFGKEKLFKDVDHKHKVHIMDDLHIARLDGILKDGDIVYECNKHEFQPTKICMARDVYDGIEKFTEITDVSLSKLIEVSSDINFLENKDLIKIVKKYLNKSLILNDEVVDILNKYNYKNSLDLYIFMPILIYIIKDLLKNK